MTAMTNAHDRLLLLRVAREAIASFVSGRPVHVPGEVDILSRRCGAFVTLLQCGDLRGCIGHIEPTERLGALLARCPGAACSTDPRFPPVAPEELDAIDIEISLLGPVEAIAGPHE